MSLFIYNLCNLITIKTVQESDYCALEEMALLAESYIYHAPCGSDFREDRL